MQLGHDDFCTSKVDQFPHMDFFEYLCRLFIGKLFSSSTTLLQCSQWLEGSMEWISVTPWLRSGVGKRSHSNSVEWSGVVGWLIGWLILVSYLQSCRLYELS
jgi:hypothetical protein